MCLTITVRRSWRYASRLKSEDQSKHSPLVLRRKLGGSVITMYAILGSHIIKKFFQFSSQVIVAHIVTYIGVGVLAFMFITRELFNPNGIAAQIMRTPDQPDVWRHVTVLMLPFQILRGFLIAIVLFPFLPCLYSWPYWKRVVTIGGLYMVLGQWASTIAGSGTIEGWLILKPEFTTFPVVIKAMAEGFIQGLALSIWISKSIDSIKSLSSDMIPNSA